MRTYAGNLGRRGSRFARKSQRGYWEQVKLPAISWRHVTL